MGTSWTFGRKIGISFALLVALAVATSLVSVYALRAVVTVKDRVIDVNAQNLVGAETVRADAEAKSLAARGYLLTGDDHFVEDMRAARAELQAALGRLRADVYTDEGRRAVDGIERAEADHQSALDRAIAAKRNGAAADAIERIFEDQVRVAREALARELGHLVDQERRQMDEARSDANGQASSVITLVMTIAATSTALALALGIVLTRSLGRQIGSAVGQVQSSSSELQAAANQQATGAKEQATAMSEISTTINELLVTSRQIAESAQRVAHVAQDTAQAAKSGGETVDRSNDAVVTIRRQMELVVGHMLELGRKSQQIGTVVEIVSELAEQTNILSINASIEAAGAGEAGKRFAVVADEIRKLADRVAGSTKEIRTLMDEVRTAVNTTVMATESGSKAVDVGATSSSEVAGAFRRIAGLVSTTTEAAREIELSTRQQATAVEQVNVAVANVAQATRETEASSGQTLQTASQLVGLSRDLLRLVRPQESAG